MKALIADDEQNLTADLQRRLMRFWPSLEIIAVVHDGLAAQKILQEQSPDIAFLDIRMPGMSGLDVARAARADCRLVFVTAFDDYAVAAFEQAAVDYLLKPVSDERLSRCVTRLQSTQAATQHAVLSQLQQLLQTTVTEKPAVLRWLRAQVGQVVRMIAVEDVCYFQAADKYTAVFTCDSELLLRTPIKELIEQLDPEQFWQVHRGTVVNARQIISAQHDLLGKVRLTLRDRSEKIAVSRSYAHLFRQM